MFGGLCDTYLTSKIFPYEAFITYIYCMLWYLKFVNQQNDQFEDNY